MGRTRVEDVQPANAGPSLIERMWHELDQIMDRLVEPGAEAEDGLDKGRAQGVAYCLAILETPYQTDIERIRRIAMERRRVREHG